MHLQKEGKLTFQIETSSRTILGVIGTLLQLTGVLRRRQKNKQSIEVPVLKVVLFASF